MLCGNPQMVTDTMAPRKAKVCASIAPNAWANRTEAYWWKPPNENPASGFASLPVARSRTPPRRLPISFTTPQNNPQAAYLVVDTLLDNPELYEQYKLKAKPLVEQYGGEYLARGGNDAQGDRTVVPDAAGAGEIPRCRNGQSLLRFARVSGSAQDQAATSARRTCCRPRRHLKERATPWVRDQGRRAKTGCLQVAACLWRVLARVFSRPVSVP